MNEPPNSRYFAAARSGHPMVWITRSSGLATRQTSFTPSAQTCGFSPSSPNRFSLRQDRRSGLLGLFREPATEFRERGDVVPVVAHCRRGRDAHGLPRSEEVDRLVLDPPVERHLLAAHAALEQPPQRTRVDDGARQQVRPRLLPLLQHRHRHLAEALRDPRGLLDQLAEPDRAGEPGRAGADHEHADLDPLVLRIARRRDELRGGERRWVVRRFQAALRWRTSSVSLGTISCTSPTTPRSAYSKMGAFGSLLIATITPELCMPTLCWIAPEIPQAMYRRGETVLPVWPTWAAYGYQPASTTARVAATAPPSAFASSSTKAKF